MAVHPCMGKSQPKKFLRTNSRFVNEAIWCFWRNQTETGKTYSWVLEKVEEENLQNHQDSFFKLGELFSECSANWNIVFNFLYLRWDLLQWSVVPCGHI